jgi:hypothetical protein
MYDQMRKSITTLVFVVVSGLALAQAPKNPATFKPDAPDRYVVLPGDTLWGIAQRFTDSPWRWSELWNLNKDQIRNPHRIFPGDVIFVNRARGSLEVDSRGLKLSPETRSTSLANQAIPSIPASIIEPFLSRPLLVEEDGLARAPTIVGTEENRIVLAPGNLAFVRGMGDSKEIDWQIYRQGIALIDPETNKTLGFEAINVGLARVIRPGDPATIRLLSSTREVMAGDKLVPTGRVEIISYAPHPPSGRLDGRVISIFGGIAKVGEAGQQSVITLNRGKSHGVDVGTVVALSGGGVPVIDKSQPPGSGTSLKTPQERYGLAFVFRVFDNLSYALVMDVSRPVRPLDVIGNP